MTKLKTLKDADSMVMHTRKIHMIGETKAIGCVRLIPDTWLQDAAREWIHHIQDREDKTLPFFCDKDTRLPVDGDTAVIVFLKMFFNLEEP